AQQKSVGRRAVGADASFKLPGGAEPPRRTGVLQHRAQRSLLAPLSKCGEHSHPPRLRAKPYPRCCRLEGATTCLVRLTFGNESFGSAFNSGYQAEQQSLTE